MTSIVSRNRGAALTVTPKEAIEFVDGRGGGAAERSLHESIDIACIQPITGGLVAIDPDVEIGLAEHTENPKVSHARNVAHDFLDLICEVFELRQIGSNDLDRVCAFDPRQAFLDVVLDVLRKVHVDAGEFPRELFLEVFDQIVFGAARLPLLERLQRHEKFGVEKPGCVAAIVRAAMLRDHRDDFRVAFDDRTHPVHNRHSGFERNRRRHRRADPQIAFLERGQKLRSEV